MHSLRPSCGRFARILGPGYYDSRINLNRKMRNHVRELQSLGYKVTLEPAA